MESKFFCSNGNRNFDRKGWWWRQIGGGREGGSSVLVVLLVVQKVEKDKGGMEWVYQKFSYFC